MTTTEEPQVWALETWPEAPPLPYLPLSPLAPNIYVCPYVGVPLPLNLYDAEDFREALKRAWYQYDPLSWDMLPFTRDKWFNKILQDWRQYEPRIRDDMTPRFFAQMHGLLAKGGLVCVIGGSPAGQGDGKSILAQMVLHYLRQYGIKAVPHVLWEHSHMQLVIDREDEAWCVLDVDEDLTATGSESGVLIQEISNAWQTQRKAKLIIISVGVNPDKNPASVNMQLIPAGINTEYQATRFGCFAAGDFVGFAALQRKFPPEFEVEYGVNNEHGTLAEYRDRAAAHSRKVLRRGVTGVPPEMEAEHIEMVLEWLEMERRLNGEGWRPPSVDVIVTETKQFGFPTKTEGYPKRIIATALYRFGKTHPEDLKRRTEKIDLTDAQDWQPFWRDYQAAVYANYPKDYPFADRDAWMVTFAKMGLTQPQIKERLGLDIRVNSIGERIRKGVSEWKVGPSPTQLGTIGQSFVLSRIESPATASDTSRADVPDISDTGDTRTAQWAVNVKVSMESDFDRTFETSPEHTVARRCCLFLFPLLARASLYPITSENTRIDSGKMALCGIGEAMQRLAVELGIVTLISEKVKNDNGGDR